MEKREKSRGKQYSERFKFQVIREVLEGERTKEAARRFYGIKSKSAILEWTRKYSGEEGYGRGGKPLSSKNKPHASKS